jgi:hypothetical protein
MKTFSLILCALFCAAVAQARSQVLEETWTIAPPDSSWTYFGRNVAVDTSWALVQGDRYTFDGELGMIHEGAAFLYEKVGTSWVYRGVLGAIEQMDEWTTQGIAMEGGVAMVIQSSTRIFERNGSTWTEATGNIPQGVVKGPDIEIVNGKILVGTISCSWNGVVFARTAGIWGIEGRLPGNTHDCGDAPPTPMVDMDIRRAVVMNAQDESPQSMPVVKLFQPSTQPGAPAWEQVAEIPRPEGVTKYGPDITMRGANFAATGSRESGTLMFRELNGVWGRNIENMDPVDGGLQPGVFSISATSLEHNSQYYFQRNYSYDRKAYVVNVFTVEGAHFAERQRLTHRASLVGKRGGSLGVSIDTSGNRVIVGGRDNFNGDNTVRVFDMPATFSPKSFRVDEFEDDNHFFDWFWTPGSEFFVTTVGANRVWRQTSTAGYAASYLPSTETTDQAIEAEVTPLSFNGADRWVGLMARRTDDANYYYVTARNSGSVQLRKIVGGAFSTLASVPYTVTAGRKMRLRLESIGTTLRVYIDGRQRITVYDISLTHGQSGVATYRASADFDNVMLSQAPQASIFVSDFSPTDTLPWTNDFGSWQQSDGVYRQTDLVTPNSRAIIGSMSDEQVVQARVKITAFGSGNPWVGLIAKYTDVQNYTYVTLRKSGQISLRYLVDGGIHIAGEANFPVTPGTWYTLRYEQVGFGARVFVNDQLVIWSNGTAGQKGRVGLMTYRATAEFDDFTAYQP